MSRLLRLLVVCCPVAGVLVSALTAPACPPRARVVVVERVVKKVEVVTPVLVTPATLVTFFPVTVAVPTYSIGAYPGYAPGASGFGVPGAPGYPGAAPGVAPAQPAPA